MKKACTLLSLLVIFLLNGYALIGADFNAEVKSTLAKIDPIRNDLEVLLTKGHLDQANKKLLDLFPVDSRTAAESFVLGNMLYSMDYKLSYALHRSAYQQQPNELGTQLEWAMEQHRAGEYEGALKTYDAFSAMNPDYAPIHGLAADCLIRLNRVADAVNRWKMSEAAKQGTLVNLETMICAIYLEKNVQRQRADLRALAERGDVDAAVKLIALDCDYTRDWWNDGLHRGYLSADMPVLDTLPANPRITAVRCLGACDLIVEEDAKIKTAAVRQRLLADGLLIDEQHTLAPDHHTTALLISVGLKNNVFSKIEAKEWFFSKLMAIAKDSTDATLWNLIAFLMIDDPSIIDIEKQAWEATGDARFALNYLFELHEKKPLLITDPVLVKAMTQFPESSNIIGFAVDISEVPTAELLVQGIKAEYRHFSRRGLRPSARPLRSYFAELASFQTK